MIRLQQRIESAYPAAVRRYSQLSAALSGNRPTERYTLPRLNVSGWVRGKLGRGRLPPFGRNSGSCPASRASARVTASSASRFSTTPLSRRTEWPSTESGARPASTTRARSHRSCLWSTLGCSVAVQHGQRSRCLQQACESSRRTWSGWSAGRSARTASTAGTPSCRAALRGRPQRADRRRGRTRCPQQWPSPRPARAEAGSRQAARSARPAGRRRRGRPRRAAAVVRDLSEVLRGPDPVHRSSHIRPLPGNFPRAYGPLYGCQMEFHPTSQIPAQQAISSQTPNEPGRVQISHGQRRTALRLARPGQPTPRTCRRTPAPSDSTHPPCATSTRPATTN